TVLVIADIPARHRFKLIGRLGRDEVDNASGSIAAVERALGAAQDFGLAEIEEFLFKEVVSDKGNIVQCNSHSRIGGDRNRLRTNAANLDTVTGEVCFGEGQVWHLLHKVRTAGGLRRG